MYQYYQLAPTELGKLPTAIQWDCGQAISICRDVLQANGYTQIRALFDQTVREVEPEMLDEKGNFFTYNVRVLRFLPNFESFGDRKAIAVLGYIGELMTDVNLHSLTSAFDEALDEYLTTLEPLSAESRFLAALMQ
ncbi:MAG: hypothetical protein DCF25_11855 [Leptolyngbya foveolarum]|uniref:Uncharacterized protein n=1 Tax=Leptolyngbya foveolarum TaxID=47253 RepID=A0A2W4U8G9_9CYAN|nr:MAG: hypothetical protein DCF25_11855 [Leptolyngbya foveolarum]